MRTTAWLHYYYYDRQPVCDDNVRAPRLAFITYAMIVNRHAAAPVPTDWFRAVSDFHTICKPFARSSSAPYSFPGARFDIGELTGFELSNDITSRVRSTSAVIKHKLDSSDVFSLRSRRTWSSLKRVNVFGKYVYFTFNIQIRYITKIVRPCEQSNCVQ